MTQRAPIWDIWVRLFHWSLVLCVLFLLFSGKTGNGFYDWHRYVGETVFALILFRVCWGFWGSSNARLAALFTHPSKSIAHLKALFGRNLEPERGHNAAGGWAVLLMLTLLTVQAVTGLFIADEEELLEGAFYESISSEWSQELLYIHTINSKLIIAIVIFHVFMIVIYRVWGKTNLVKPMITGRINLPDDYPVQGYRIQNWSVGLFTAAVVLVLVALLVGWI